MKTKQLSWVDIPTKGKYKKYKGTCIHYNKKTIHNYVKQGMWEDLDSWARWYYKRKINYEMLRANKSKTKKTNME